jgi:hypothetical protein
MATLTVNEEVNVRANEHGWDKEIGLARFLWRYCHARPDRSRGGRIPYEFAEKPGETCENGATA